MRGTSIAVHVRSGVYTGETYPEWVASTCQVPKLDASATVEDGWCNVAVVNIDAEKDLESEFKGVREGSEVQVYRIGGEGTALGDVNLAGKEMVGIREGRWDGRGGRFVFERHSFTLLRWKI